MARSNRNDEPGVIGKIALAALIGKALGGVIKVGAMAGAAFVGWTVGRKAIDRFAGDGGRGPDRSEVATDVASP
jgi:hypothetical protein